jgi:hypothetical protein
MNINFTCYMLSYEYAVQGEWSKHMCKIMQLKYLKQKMGL